MKWRSETNIVYDVTSTAIRNWKIWIRGRDPDIISGMGGLDYAKEHASNLKELGENGARHA